MIAARGVSLVVSQLARVVEWSVVTLARTEPATTRSALFVIQVSLFASLAVVTETPSMLTTAPEEFAAGHIRGAINVPVAELRKRLHELPPEQEVVAYCRGPYCLMAFEAVAELRNRGRKARRLEHGFPEWKSAGLPVERS